MKLEIGHRYLNRQGDILSIVKYIEREFDGIFNYLDELGCAYQENGLFAFTPTEYDLVEEL